MRARTDRLREILRTAKDFREAWDYFHDELVLDPAFMRLGSPRASRKLETTLAAIGSRLLGSDAKLRSSVILFIKESIVSSIRSSRAIWQDSSAPASVKPERERAPG